ncbi:hypothetical protein GMI69_05630 [Eggerthellaceae bacterium zg-887]|uniref:CAP domain-containing protein n=1 Tax=Xiamenia xianingshaonis TaxID=2682776 RepID=UPI0014095E4E|nr:CAP domain-containing protein [Xiamenia xianingshaonis]NHM16141.1 hypothetical protein [Xiamenia xianingshaonis]
MMKIHKTWFARLVALALGTVVAFTPVWAYAAEESEGVVGEAPIAEGVTWTDADGADGGSEAGEAAEAAESGETTEAAVADGAAYAEARAASGLDVVYRSKEDIKARFQSSDLDLDYPIVYDLDPQAQVPYATGALTAQTLDQAVQMLNLYRYAAGLDANVALDDDYVLQCQTGSLIMAANQAMDHHPYRPSGMDQALYEIGYDGCSSSNIAYGYSTLQGAIRYGWMHDGNASNIAALGHRRWILNPTMGKTGFGAALTAEGASYWRTTYSAMYSFDRSNSWATQSMVAWPAQNTPVELVSDSLPWSVSFESSVPSTARVQVTSQSTGQVWNFSSSGSDGEFYLSNAGYGDLYGCVIFRPEGISMQPGDCYTVSVTGVPTPVQYTVEFFEMTEEITSVSLDQTTFEYEEGYAFEPLVTVMSGDTVLVGGEDYSVEYLYNYYVGEAMVRVSGINHYRGELETTFTITPKPVQPEITLSQTNFNYTGYEIEPYVTVYVDGEEVPYYDYEVTYENNMQSGTATARVDLTGNYTGSATATFTINESQDSGHVTPGKDDETIDMPGKWLQSQGHWWFQRSDGSYPRDCWANIDHVWYHFDESGWMETGWVQDSGYWFYFDGSGALATGWRYVNNAWYYLYPYSYGTMPLGAMMTGWVQIDDVWYYFNGAGAMQAGWEKIGGTWYYFAGSGAMLTGWQYIDGVWYYFASSGAMVTGWRHIGDGWYYFTGSGAMASNCWIGNYYVGGNGVMLTDTWIGEYYVGADGLWDQTA